MNQNKYQPISTIKISAKSAFYWVECPSSSDPHRVCILQSYPTNLGKQILEPVQAQIDQLLPLKHPHLQSLIDAFSTDDGLHIVQELEQWACAIDRSPYTAVRAKTLLQEIIPVLIYLHNQGITHGNISPETIVVNERDRHILTNFLVIVDSIAKVGGETYPSLRSQLEQIPVLNIPNGEEWDLYSLGVTTIRLLTNLDYKNLYDPRSHKWKWASYVDCSEELSSSIDRLLGQGQKPLNITLDSLASPIVHSNGKISTDRVSQPQSIDRPNFLKTIFILSLLGTCGLGAYFIWDKFQPRSRQISGTKSQVTSFPTNQNFRVGYINRISRDRSLAQERDYPKFRSYLETRLRQKYGNNIKVELESVVTNKEAKNNIKYKKWDLAFTSSANNSIIAEDNKYEFIARMSANEDPYRDVCFFVAKNSTIKSVKDFTPDRTIALPSDDSPIFVMPLTDIYGKRMRVNLGNTLSNIQDKVKAKEADIGVNFCKTIAKNPEFRTLSPNRVIPVGAVFLSPRIEKIVDREYIKEAIVQAPDDIQKNANYTRSSGINYTQFRRINDRANQLLRCVDFTRNPVDFYCNKPNDKDKGF